MKVPHAVALHGLQALGLLALILERTILPESRRAWLVLTGIAGYTLALIVATIQTFGGRAPLDLMPFAVVGAALAVLVIALAYAATLRAAQMARAVGGVPAN
jgi:Na+/H+ antiporter NhaA